MAIHAALTPTDVGYFTTVATVIPVLLLASVVQVNTLGRGGKVLISQAERAGMAASVLMIFHGGFGEGVFFSRLFKAIGRALVIGAVLAVCVPAAAEVAAVLALAHDRAWSFSKPLTETGLFVAGVAVLGPLLYALTAHRPPKVGGSDDGNAGADSAASSAVPSQ